jgi:hypothetical protein
MNQFEPLNPVAALLADAWIDAARRHSNPMTYEQEQLAREECARFSERQGFRRDSSGRREQVPKIVHWGA